MKILSRFNDGLSRYLFIGAMIGCFGIMAIIVLNVFARYIFDAPFYWAEEVAAVLMVLVSLFPAAELWKRGAHINFEIIQKILSEAMWKRLQIVICLVTMIFSGVLAWQGLKATHLVWARNMREPSLLGTPLWIPYSLLFLGVGALFLRLIASLWTGMKNPQ